MSQELRLGMQLGLPLYQNTHAFLTLQRTDLDHSSLLQTAYVNKREQFTSQKKAIKKYMDFRNLNTSFKFRNLNRLHG